jgi:hypothetical protein
MGSKFGHLTDEQLVAAYRNVARGAFSGYMGDKRKQLVLEHGFDTKNAAHCVRLLRMCKEFLQTGHMEVYRTSDAQELLDIKKGKWPLDQVKALAEQLFAEIKVARDTSPLPDGPNRKEAEQLLMDMIHGRLASDIGHD